MNKEIIKYIKDNRGQKVGVLVGLKDEDGQICVGWSKYAVTQEYEPFSREKGLKIARGRALCTHDVNADLPFAVLEEIPYFLDRCERYFKDGQM